MRSILFLLLGLTFLMAEIVPTHADGSFRATGSLSQHRRLHTATLLPDGRVLVCGGIFDAPGTAIASAEVYDPGTGTWSLTAPLQTGRMVHTATLLQNGTVLVTGGYHQTAGRQASSEIYDPATGSWTRVGDMQLAHTNHSATLLQDGRVLVAGGALNNTPIANVEIYDPATRTWSAAASMASARTWHSASLLADGRVLVMGGYKSETLATVERYDPSTNAWTSLPAMLTPRYSFGITHLVDGRVLVAGGFGIQNAIQGAYVAKTELFDPVAETWSAAGDLNTARVGPSLTLLPDGRVLAAGGFSSARSTAAADLFDPMTNLWRAISPLRKGRTQHTATLLNNGQVLVVGGHDVDYNQLASAELCDPTLLPVSSALRAVRSTGEVLENGDTAHFREVAPGELDVASFTVTNSGSTALTGLRWTLEGAQAGSFVLTSPVQELPAGASATFQVAFMPVTEGLHLASLRIDLGAAHTTQFVMELRGSCADRPVDLWLEEVGAGPAAQVIDFGSPAMGTTVRKSFRLVNAGGRTFTGWVNLYNPSLGQIAFLSGLTLYPTTTAPLPGFSVINPYFRFTLRPGESRSFDIAWNPQDTQRVQQTVQVTEFSTGSVKRSFQVVGAGTRASVIQNHVLFRFGDGQSLSVFSGAPVTAERAQHLGNTDIWDGLYGQPIFSPWPIQYSFQGMLQNTGTMATGPTLLPLTPVGGALSPIGSRAALHFSAGDSLSQHDFGLGQHTNLGVQLWVRAEGVTGTHPLVHAGDPAGDGMGLWQVDGVFKGRLSNGAWVGEAPVQVGVWQHLALVRQGITSTLHLNGQAVGPTSTAEIRTPQLLSGGSLSTQRIKNLKVGGALTAGGSSFTGDMDELQFFTLAPGAVFSPQAELAPGAQPDLRVQSSPQPVPAVMVGRSMTFYAEITNVGSGIATITPQAFTGDGATDYLLQSSGTSTWQDSLSVPTTRTLAPGERWLLEVTFTPRTVGLRPAALRLLTTDPQRPEIELSFSGVGVEAQPRLIVGQSRTQETDRVSFGRVLLGTTKGTNIFVGNAGGLNLTGLSLRVVGPQADRFQIGSLQPYFQINPGTMDPLPPGRQAYALLSYTPDATDIDTAWLEITSNDPAEPLKRLLLYGRGIPPTPDIHVRIDSQDMISGMTSDFGAADLGMTNNGKYFGVSNPGTGPLNITDLRIEGDAAADFSLRDRAVNAGSVLNAGEVRPSGMIEFTPSAIGQRSARLVVESDDPDESPFVVHLTGEGLPPRPEIAVLDGSRELTAGHALLHVGHATPGGPSVSRQLTIRNEGGAPLTGLRAFVQSDRATRLHLFALPGMPFLAPTLAAGASTTLSVHFTPQELGPDGALLVIESHDADEPRYEIQLGGTGAYGASSLLRPDRPGWTTTALAEAPDGTILLAGYTATAGSAAVHQVRRITKNGSELTSKVQTQFPNGEIKAISLQLDGRVVIVGDFTQVGLAKRQGIARLNRDGTLDATFTPPTGGFRGRDVLVLPTGKIMLAGAGSLGTQANLIRLNANGTLDTSFTLVSPNAPVNALALEADGSVLFGGEYTNAVEMLATGGNSQLFSDGDLRRIKPDGKLDPLFGFGRRIYDIVIQGEDIYVAHRETRLSLSLPSAWIWEPVTIQTTTYADTLTRLSRSGSVLAQQTLDSFPAAAECLPRTLAFQPGGGLLVAPGPRFWNSPGLQQISRYRRDTLAVDAGFYAILGQPADVCSMHVQADGKVLLGGQFTDVNAWSGFFIDLPGSPPRIPTTGQPGNGNGGPALGFAQLSHEGNFRPDLRVKEQASGTALSDGLSALEMNAGTSAETTVKLDVSSILNLQPAYPSTAPTNLVIEIEGDHAADFTAEIFQTPPTSHHIWNDVELTLRFRPSASGLRSARLRLSLESMTRHGYAQNVFELNLRGVSGSVAPLTNLSFMLGQALTLQLADASLYDRFEATGLPPGITLNRTTGQLTGRATRAGTFVVKARVRDRVTGAFTSFTLTLEVLPQQLAGQYLGLLERHADVLHGRGGLLSLVVTANGSWTATLQVNLVPTKTTTHRLSGTLNVTSSTEASGSASIPRAVSLAPLALAFEIRQGALSIFLDQSLVGEGGRTSTQSSLVGACHLALLPAAGVPERLAVGFARANFTAKGVVTIASKMTHAVRPEVRPLTQSTTWITGAGSSPRVPFYVPLAQGETVSGWLLPEAGSTTLLTSMEAGCTVPSSPYQDSATMTHWKAGDAAMVIRGGLWTPPARGTRLLGAGNQTPNARITVSQLTQDFTLTATHQARPPGSAWLRPERGGVVQSLTTTTAGTFSGWTWFAFTRQGLVAPASANISFGMCDGLFIPGLNQGIGLFQSAETPPAGRYPATTPGVIIEALD